MQYRPEIDGLRALAVLPVIFFHAGFSTFSGGYVGVDVFFVISGYLITAIIRADMQHGTFSLARFYERRARRILPALLLVLLVCLPAAYVWLLPADLRQFAQSLASVALFSANFLFWHEAGYFDSAAQLKPLLHTWSLAVEEQFYLVFPLLLLGLRHRAAPLMHTLLLPWALALLALASFALAQWAAAAHPAAAFYLLPMRAWELLLGAGVAIYLEKPQREFPRRLQQAGGILGLLLLGAAIFFYDEHTPMPGVFALAPTLGTALLILCAQPHTLAGKLLAQRTLVATGLTSYSAYLWHQPLFAFARHASLDEPTSTALLLLSALALLLGYLTWAFVERPFRDHTRVGTRQFWRLALAAAALLLAAGIAGHFSSGMPARFPEAVQALRMEHAPRRGACHSSDGATLAPASACALGDARHVVGALLGDSHADALAPALQDGLATAHVGLRQMTANGCPPVPGLARREYPFCTRYNAAVQDVVRADTQLQWLLVSARWTLALEQTRFDNTEGGRERGEAVHVDAGESRATGAISGSDSMGHADNAARRARVAAHYVAAIKNLLADNRKVVLVYPVPEAGWHVPDRLSKILLRNGKLAAADASTSYRVFLQRNAGTIAALDSIGEHPGLLRVRPDTLFCNTRVPDRCITHRDGVALYRDDDHLSNAAARWLLQDAMQQIAADNSQAAP